VAGCGISGRAGNLELRSVRLDQGVESCAVQSNCEQFSQGPNSRDLKRFATNS
jgi:hypothetical protein